METIGALESRIDTGEGLLRRSRALARRNPMVGWTKAVAALMMVVSVSQTSAADLGATAQAEISRYRQRHGLYAVTVDARLMQLAQDHANAMARAGVLDHNAGGPFAARIARYNPSVAAENIAAGFRDFRSVLDIWKRSFGHNANLLKSGVTRIGIASAQAPRSSYKVFWTLILARPDGGRGPARGPRRRAPTMFLISP